MIPWDWNTTPQERAARFPCDDYLDTLVGRLTRAITIAAPPPIVFRWLCQLKVAPYSYDWLDNRGRRNPRRLTPGAERLALGQRLLVFELVEFQHEQSLTGVVQPRFQRLCGPLAVTYAIQPRHDGSCRLVVRPDVGATTPRQPPEPRILVGPSADTRHGQGRGPVTVTAAIHHPAAAGPAAQGSGR